MELFCAFDRFIVLKELLVLEKDFLVLLLTLHPHTFISSTW